VDPMDARETTSSLEQQGQPLNNQPHAFLNCSRACSLVDAGAGLGWLVLVCCERTTLLAGWFGLAETNKRTS